MSSLSTRGRCAPISNGKKLTYAEACKQYANAKKLGTNDKRMTNNIHLSCTNDFPSLPRNDGASPINVRTNVPTQERDPITSDQSQKQDIGEVQTEVMDQVVNQTLLAKEANKPIDIYKIISDSAGKRMRLAIDIKQLKQMS